MKPEMERHRVTMANCPSHVPFGYCSTAADGFNGMFRLVIKGRQLRIIASDGMGWEHVSVSIEGDDRTPPWGIMCEVKDLFWSKDTWVVQFHPPESEYVNYHKGCLHLWRPTKETLPTPLSLMVGPKAGQSSAQAAREFAKSFEGANE